MVISAHAPEESAPGLVVACRPGQGVGFRLAGVRVEEVAAGEEVARLEALLAETGLGVLAVEQRLLDAAGELPRHGGQKLLLPFRYGAARAGEGGREYVAELVRRAVGYHIKLGEGG